MAASTRLITPILARMCLKAGIPEGENHQGPFVLDILRQKFQKVQRGGISLV
jgi:hypothetical protein